MQNLSAVPADRDRSTAVPSDPAEADRVYRKITLRLIPFLFLCYVLNYLDRANISFARLQFSQDLHLSDAAFGFGVGLFFVGYMLFEVPSNLYLERAGLRRTLMRIMVLWGIVSTCTAFVSTPAQFYAARVLLGVAEAGFFPGIVLYFTYWFPSARRARVTSIFLTAICVSGVVGGPLSGWIMHFMDGAQGMRGWQWLFVLEGFPSILVGLCAWFYLTDRPGDATWLTDAEKQLIEHHLALERETKKNRQQGSIMVALRDKKFYFVAFGYFSVPWASNVAHIWAPSIIRKSGVENLWYVGLLSSIPYIVGAVVMIAIGLHSDRKLERRWHFGLSSALAAFGTVCLPLAANNWVLSVLFLSITTAGYLGMLSLFWTIPPAYLSTSVAASGIGLISSLGQFGGISAPVVIGAASTHLGSTTMGMLAVALVSLLGGLAILLGVPAAAINEVVLTPVTPASPKPRC